MHPLTLALLRHHWLTLACNACRLVVQSFQIGHFMAKFDNLASFLVRWPTKKRIWLLFVFVTVRWHIQYFVLLYVFYGFRVTVTVTLDVWPCG